VYGNAERIRMLNTKGYSNRAIARELGISRESVNKAVLAMGAVSPYARPVRMLPMPATKGGVHRAGDVLAYFTGGFDDVPVALRAVVLKRYKRFLHCRVEALQDGQWMYVYDQCFGLQG